MTSAASLALLESIAPFTEQRSFDRLPLDCPARLVTVGSYRTARLRDLSRGGARLALDDPPPEGTAALLQWNGHEALCQVVWASPKACGVSFEKLIPADLVTGSRVVRNAVERRPGVGIANISFGTKRGQSAPGSEGYREPASNIACWTVVLTRHLNLRTADPTTVGSAAEMFFFGSPLAHVVQYEEVTAKMPFKT